MSDWMVGTFDDQIWLIPRHAGYSARKASEAKRQGPEQFDCYLIELGAFRALDMMHRAETAEAEVERLKRDQNEWRKGVILIRSALGDVGADLCCSRIAEVALTVRAEHEQTKTALALLGEGWLPTSDAINALPEGVRQFICDLETRCDPAGIVAQNAILADQAKQLQAALVAAREEIAALRDLLTAHRLGDTARADRALKKLAAAVGHE